MYTDKGGEIAGPGTGQKVYTLRNTEVKAVDFDSQDGVQVQKYDEAEVVILNDPSYISFEKLDLTNIGSLTFSGFNRGPQGALIEVHLESPDGPAIAKTSMESIGIEVREGTFAAQATVQLKKAVGLHDIYITAKSKIPGANIGGLSTITFNPR
jgi:hypothetical protein